MMRKNLKKIGRSILSSILCLKILLSGLCFFDIGSVISEALIATSSNALADADSTDSSEVPVYFYVPEAIYLAPRSASWGAATSSTFRYFIQNTVNTSDRTVAPTPKSDYDTTGYVYFSYANLSGNVTLSTRLYKSDLKTALSGGSISSLTMSDDGQYKKATISSSSTSPSLGSADTGYYIEWTASFKDAFDGYDKVAVAYTYVYKPYVVPYGGSISAQNDRGWTNSDAGQITWITGVHSINKEGEYYARYTTSNLNKGFLPFISDSAYAINGNSSYKGMNLNFSGYSEQDSLAKTKYSAFANDTKSQSYFFGNQTNQTFNNMNGDSWLTTTANASTTVDSGTTFNKKTFSYNRYDDDCGSSKDRGRSTTQTAKAEGTIYIDTSRYNNLAQIPNLGVGIFVTRDDNSDNCAWYVADYTGLTNKLNANDPAIEGENPQKVKDNFDDHGTIMVRYGTYNDRKTDGEGVKYNGTWVSKIPTNSTGDKKYTVRGTYYNYQGGDTIVCSVMINMNAKLDDKASLRSAVRKAQMNFANLGIYNNSYNSYYFTSSTINAYTNFIDLYKSAELYLTAVDKPLSSINSSYTSASTLATALESALNTLLAGNSLATKTAYQYNVGLRPTSSGTYELISFPTNQLDYTARENVTFTPDSNCLGYNNYLGSTKVTSAQGSTFTNTGASVCSISNNLDSVKSTLISSSNTKQYSSTISGSILTIGNPNSEHTTKPKTVSATSSGYASEITYNYTAAAKDIAIYMISFYVGNTYEVDYVLDGGTAGKNAPTSATYDVPFAVSPPTKKGYKFVGWTVTSGLDTSTAKYGDTESPSTTVRSSDLKCCHTTNATESAVYFSNLTPKNGGKVILTANWIPILELNWKFNGIDNDDGDINKAFANIYVNDKLVKTGVADYYDGIEPGSTVRIYVNIIEDGWVFTNFTSSNYIEFIMPTKPTEKRPELCSKYKVVFNGNGNTGGSTKQQEFVWGTAQYLNANGFTKTGYTFASWNTAANGSGTSYSDKQSVNSLTTDLNGTVNLYAQWSAKTITLEYELNGGTSTTPAGSTFKYDSPVTTAATPTREHTITYNANGGTVSPGSAKATYNFTGWKSSVNGRVYNPATAYTDSFGATEGTVILTAQWNGGVVTLPNPTRTGYSFAGWYDAASGGNKIGDAGESYPVTENKIVYAHWTANKYTVTLDQQNGTGGTESVTATYDSAMPAATMPSRTGYTFKGYFTGTNGTGTQYYNADGTSTRNWNIAEKTTLHAYWTNNTYTVTLDQQNGTGGTASVQATYDKAMPAATMPTRTGYTFGGYFTGTNGSGTQYYTASGASANNWNIDSNTTLYAKWTAKTYTVTLDQQNGTGGTESVTATYDSAMPAATMPTRTGYTFGGYFTGTNGSGTQYYTALGASANNWNIDSNTTLYAKWTANNYKLTFDKQGGTGGTDTATATYDSAMPAATMPTRTGYIFGGYYTETNGSGTQYYTEQGAGIGNWNLTSDTTLYAKWTAISYTVAYDLDGGTAGGTYPTSATYDRAYLLSAPSRNGWTFAGWILLDSGANFSTAKYGVNATEVLLSFSSGKKTAIPSDIYFKNLTSTNGNSVTLKAIWQKKGTVYFNYLNASSVKQTTTVNFSFTTDSPSVEVNIPTVATSVTYDGRTFTMRGWKQSYLPSDPATVSSDSTTVTVDSTGYTDVGDVYVNYYAMYDCDVTLSYNVNGGNSAAPASESKKQYINPTDKTEADSIAYTTLSFSVTNIVPTIENGDTFIGWSTIKDGTVEYIGSSTITIYVNTTLYAVWIKSDSAEEEAENQQFTKTVVAYGYNAVTGKSLTYDLTESFDGWDPTDYNTYRSKIEVYKTCKKEYVDNPSSIESIKKYQKAVKELNEATNTLSDKSIVSSFLENMTIIYKDGAETKTITNASVKNINLNHYSTATLDVLYNNYVAAKGLLKNKLKDQSKLNTYVFELAKNYTSYDDIGSKPTVDFYETPETVKNILNANSAVEAVNYVYSGKGGYTYYCYVNSKTPTVVLNAVEESVILKEANDASKGSDSTLDTASTGDNASTRSAYPTRATVTSNGGASAVTTKQLASSDYSSYLDEGKGIGSNYSGYVNGKLLTGKEYYSAYTQIKLTPEFSSDRQEVVYTIKATDDALVKNTESNSFATDINYAATANMSGTTPTTVSKMTTALSDPSQGITICFCYHNPGDSFDVVGDTTGKDTYANLYHLYRYSGGASNWELPKANDGVYTVNDKMYGQSDRGSFTFTFKYGSENSFNIKEKTDEKGNTVYLGYDITLNTINTNDIVEYLSNEENFNKVKACTFRGTKYTLTDENGQTIRDENNRIIYYEDGIGLGYQPWGTNWSFSFYPQSESYTYVHLVDRWGNTVDKVFSAGKQDINGVKIYKMKLEGQYTVKEDGGSGIDTLSLNSSGFEILTDENSTLENNVFRTSGNTVRISTGEANKAYTLTMTDKATNSSTATVKSDENGIITLSVEDTAYENGVYTFMLNSIEVNLYDGAETDKYVLSVTGDEVDEGEAAQITVTTKGDVSKLRFTDESGNTSTVSSFVQNDDGTRTWTFAKARPAGEYTYKITVKVGHEWLDEGDTATLIFNERILDSGKVRSAEYDEETGLYKVTFEGRATKVQFVSEDGMTRTYTRYAEAVKSKKTYDADGNEVNDTARTLDHEVWYVEAKLYSGQNYTVAGKFEAGWNRAENATSTVTGK